MDGRFLLIIAGLAPRHWLPEISSGHHGRAAAGLEPHIIRCCRSLAITYRRTATRPNYMRGCHEVQSPRPN